MNPLTRQLSGLATAFSQCFAAGAFGGLVNFLLPILFGYLHITTAAGVHIAPTFHKVDLYHKIFWGGLWGVVFLLHIPNRFIPNIWAKAALYGLGPSLVQLFIVFPLATGFGVGGIGLGALTPLFVLIFNTIGWSLPAYWWFLLIGPDVHDDTAEGGFTLLDNA